MITYCHVELSHMYRLGKVAMAFASTFVSGEYFYCPSPLESMLLDFLNVPSSGIILALFELLFFFFSPEANILRGKSEFSSSTLGPLDISPVGFLSQMFQKVLSLL